MSLPAQKQEIENYVKIKGSELVRIYEDAGITGKAMEKRLDLRRLMRDAETKKFDVVVTRDVTRFGRNMVDSLNNIERLDRLGIRLISLHQNLDFSTTIGKLIFTILAGFAQIENENRAETSLESKLALARDGHPSSGRLPFARLYSKENGWQLDDEKAELMRWAAIEYLEKNRSKFDIADDLKARWGFEISGDHLLRVLKKDCGDKWTVKIGGEQFIFVVPPILDEKTIERVKTRVEQNRTNNKQKYRKYSLAGFIRCGKCGKSLGGHTQHGKFQYYKHPGRRYSDCNAFNAIPLKKIEDAVFTKILENTVDEVGFQNAIKDSLPDKKHIVSLKRRIADNEKALKKIENDLDKLVEIAISGTLKKETIQDREKGLYEAKAQLTEEIERDKQRLRFLPSVDQIEKQAEFVRRNLMLHFGSEDRLKEMSYDEKRQLLHFLFDGKDNEGTPYGIYVEKIGKGEWEYFIYGCLIGDGQRITGLSILKGDDIDYGMPKIDWDKYFQNGKDRAIPESIRKERPTDNIYDGPAYEAWLEYVKQGENYKTCDLSQHL
jgi:site-specific DNA recombinase